MKTILATTEAGLRPSLRARYLYKQSNPLSNPFEFDCFTLRSDPALVAIFEELGAHASHTPFVILDVPNDFKDPYLDTEHDGLEVIRESHRILRPVQGTRSPEPVH